MNKILLCGLSAALLTLPNLANAQTALSYGSSNLRGDDHAPIGVMGDHLHGKGEWMVSYRFMRMHMEDNRIDDSSVSPETIATTIPNRFAGTPMQPATLRVVPLEMTTNMHMVGGMYAPSDNITLMAMANYIDREMNHVTFQGGAGTTRLGEFKTSAHGFGDTTIAALIRLHKDDVHNIHLNTGLSLPTGSIDEEDDVLAPDGNRPRLRMPYAMQLGSGTFDAKPGITYYGHQGRYGWGAQYAGTFRLGRNSEDYSWGDKHQLSTWASYSFTPSVSLSGRITAETESQIDGIDSEIVAPVQTANPDNYGGERISASLGLNTVIRNGALKGHRFAIEGTIPVYQNLNGPQLERDHMITFGWQKAF